MTMTTISMPIQRSSAKSRALQPGNRGECSCLCQGEVMMMLGTFGWVMSFDDIERSESKKAGGRIHVHQSDVASGKVLRKGDIVSFYLYADEQGLGAESCSLVEAHAPPNLTGSCKILRGLGETFLAALKEEANELGPIVDNMCCPTSQDLSASCNTLRGLGATILAALNEEADELGPIDTDISCSIALSDNDGDQHLEWTHGLEVLADKKPAANSIADDSTSAGTMASDEEDMMAWADVHSKVSKGLVNALASDEEAVMPWADVHAKISQRLSKEVALDETDDIAWADGNARMSRCLAKADVPEDDVVAWADVHDKISRGLAQALASDEVDENAWVDVNARISRGRAMAVTQDEVDDIAWADVNARMARGLAKAMEPDEVDDIAWADVNARMARGLAKALKADEVDDTAWPDVNARIARSIANAVASAEDDAASDCAQISERPVGVTVPDQEDILPWAGLFCKISRGLAIAVASDDDGDDEGDDEASVSNSDDSGIDGDLESNDGDGESIDSLSHHVWQLLQQHGEDVAMVSKARRRQREVASDGESTSVGSVSDSGRKDAVGHGAN